MMRYQPKTLAGRLALEISRVTRLLCQYEEVARVMGDRSAGVLFTSGFMRDSLEKALAAADNADIEGQMQAVKELVEYQE